MTTPDSTARSDSALGGWRPIETAPKKGRVRLAWHGPLWDDGDIDWTTAEGFYSSVGWIAACLYSSTKRAFPSYEYRECVCDPTHWQPLPEPPTPQKHLQHKG